MKNMKTSLYYFLLLALPLFIISCSKEGPTGPAGQTGAAGAPGPAGPAGVAGPAGTANVIYSAWLDVTFTDQVNPNNNADTSSFAEIAAPKLTSTILSQGEIKVYWNLGSAAAPVVVPLPYFDGGFIMNAVYEPQIISLVNNWSNYVFGTYTEAGVKYSQYRYVLIPGGAAARVMPDGNKVDWNSYASVQKYLGLKD